MKMLYRHLIGTFALAALLGLLIFCGGCGHRTGTSQVSNESLTSSPPPGKPNHMSPQEQAMLQHYAQMGQKK
jgi:hypothetical protein